MCTGEINYRERAKHFALVDRSMFPYISTNTDMDVQRCSDASVTRTILWDPCQDRWYMFPVIHPSMVEWRNLCEISKTQSTIHGSRH